ncbi:hypothetical protein TBR22_A35780 [Luteitalea sp. TBR-22]|uniref:DinB family protein n=1 Tax=Luteitalea sp. TBR-22 TaxID=2802971 RepID=UPI001AF479FD|nr:DinB family protein [Luteitalea sp. TBR-22]BCS34348.1 hypothetical protein TBR22_A35780 [Luteitalea sp. TBR-22]
MIGRLLRLQLDAEVALSRLVLDAVHGAPLDWRPHPASFSLGRLAMHVATIPSWTAAIVRTASYDMGAGGPGPDVPASSTAIVEAHDAAIARAREVLDGLDEPALVADWTLLRDGIVIETMPRVEALSRFVVRHLVHHRGQLCVYLRECGIAVPPIYGDSADRRLLPPDLAS